MKQLKKPQIAVRALISNLHGEILILKRTNTSFGNGKWNLPGGKIEFAETAKQAIANEINEETGLTCTSAKFLTYLDNLPTKDYSTHFVTLFFACDCTGKIGLNKESSDYSWLKPDNLDQYQIAFEQEKIIAQYPILKKR